MEASVVWVTVIIWILFWGSIGATIGASKGRTLQGALLGVGLSFIGVIVIAMMPPTDTKLAERDRAQAQILREVIGPAADAGAIGSSGSVGVAITPQVRQQLLAEAISRDPSLADASDPAALKRLGESMAALETEYGLKQELAQLRAAQAAAAQDLARAAARAEREEADRHLAAQEQLAARAREQAEQEQAALAQSEVETARAEQLAGMKRLPRWMATHKAHLVVAAAIVIVIGLITGGVLVGQAPGTVAVADATPSPTQGTTGLPSPKATPAPKHPTRTDGKVSLKYLNSADCTLLFGSTDKWGSKLKVGSSVHWEYRLGSACALVLDSMPDGIQDERSILLFGASYDKRQLIPGYLWTARSHDGRGAVQWGEGFIWRDWHFIGLTSSQKRWVRTQSERAAGKLAP